MNITDKEVNSMAGFQPVLTQAKSSNHLDHSAGEFIIGTLYSNRGSIYSD